MEATTNIKIKYKLFLKNLVSISYNPLYQIIAIFLLALVLRVYKLGEFPIGFHIDEVKVGWNAFSILKTFRDDHNNLLQLYYNTFGDYRPTGIFYLSIPAIAIFGNTVFATRLTSAFFGALSVFPIYYLSNLFFKKEKTVGIYASLILSILPWHISISRATSEVAISGFFILSALVFAYKNKFSILTYTNILISYLLYHSARLVLPVYLLFSSFTSNLNKKYLYFAVILTILLSLGGASRERLKQVSLFNNENVVYELQQSKELKIIVYTRELVKEYGKYFSTDFLIGESAKPYRYLTPGVGLINYIDLALLLIGIYLLVSKRQFTMILFLLASPLAAILTMEDSPNLHRSFYMVLFIAIIEGYALSQIRFKRIILFIMTIGLIYFLSQYFRDTLKLPYQKNLYIDSPTYRNIGNVELSKMISSFQENYDLIYVSNFPDNLYPWYAFLNKKDPKDFNASSLVNSNERKYQNIIFTDTKCPSDYAFENQPKHIKILVVDSGECPTESKIKDGLNVNLIEEIKRIDGSTSYTLLNQNNY